MTGIRASGYVKLVEEAFGMLFGGFGLGTSLFGVDSVGTLVSPAAGTGRRNIGVGASDASAVVLDGDATLGDSAGEIGSWTGVVCGPPP
eukprot:scaffold10648_cov76-Amphora_coffeaeformis.AAC.1